MWAAASIPGREVDADRRGSRARHESRQRSPVPHARSRTSDPLGGDPSASTVRRRQPLVEPERDHAVHAVVPGREPVEHALDRVVLLVALGQRAVASGGRPSRLGPFPAGLVARGRELGRVADRFEVLLRDLEQHAAEVVATSVVTVGSNVRNASTRRSAFSSSSSSLRLDRAPDVLVEHLDRVGRRSRGSRSWCRRASASRSGAGSRPRAGAARRAARRRRRRCSRTRPSRCCGTISPSRDDRVEQRRGHPTRPASSSRVEQLGVAGLRAGDRGRQRHVGGVELTVEQPADHRERESLALEVLDPLQPLDVVGAVPGDAARRGGAAAAAGASGRSGWCRPTRRRAGRAPPPGWRRRPLP